MLNYLNYTYINADQIYHLISHYNETSWHRHLHDRGKKLHILVPGNYLLCLYCQTRNIKLYPI